MALEGLLASFEPIPLALSTNSIIYTVNNFARGHFIAVVAFAVAGAGADAVVDICLEIRISQTHF